VEELSVLADKGLRELLADKILPETDPYYARSAGVAIQLLRANSGVVSCKHFALNNNIHGSLLSFRLVKYSTFKMK
jgi:hypothetical protein